MPLDISTPEKALTLAMRLIDSYQFDIRNSDWTGVDLLEKGFCQGDLYLRWSKRLHEAYEGWRAADPDAYDDGT